MQATKATTDILSAIAEDYRGDDYENTHKLAQRIGRKLTSVGKAANEAGAILRKVRDSGLALAAITEDASDEDDHSVDGRTSAVSRFMADYAPSVDPKRYAEWLQMADSLAALEDAEVSTDGLSPSVHRKMTKNITPKQWAAAVRKAQAKAAKAAAKADKAVKSPTAAAVAAELPNAKPRSGKATTTVPASLVLTHGNALLIAITEDGFTPTEDERDMLANIVAAIG